VPSPSNLARNVRRLSRLELAGAGQVTVEGKYAYVGHITNKEGLGTSILDVSDRKKPRLLCQLNVDLADSHSHKARVAGDLMIVNVEQNMGKGGRKSADGAPEQDSYREGGFKVYDISNRGKPKLITHHRTHGRGVHRFDMDEKYAYISTEMEGFIGNILVVYDIADPRRPSEVSRWWMPGQHIAGGETPTWSGRRHRLHHALRFGDELWASCWHGGFWVVDCSDIARPRSLGSYNYHPPFPEPTHTVMPLPARIGGRRIAVSIDEEDQAQSASEEQARRGRLHAGLATFDVSDPAAIRPLGLFEVSEMDSPFSRTPGTRFGAHQYHEAMTGTLVYAVWFSGGLRIIDVADPMAPREVGHFIPEPAGGNAAPQSNDVMLDQRGLIHMVDRLCGYDVLEASV